MYYYKYYTNYFFFLSITVGLNKYRLPDVQFDKIFLSITVSLKSHKAKGTKTFIQPK